MTKIEAINGFRQIIENIIKDDRTPSGDVVGIIKRNPRKYCGHLEIPNLNDSNVICNFIPVDTRFPNFLMLINNPQEVFNKKIMIKLKEWPINSGQPIGTFLQIIGEIGHMDTESKVILLEHNVEFRPFSKQVLECLPLDNY